MWRFSPEVERVVDTVISTGIAKTQPEAKIAFGGITVPDEEAGTKRGTGFSAHRKACITISSIRFVLKVSGKTGKISLGMFYDDKAQLIKSLEEIVSLKPELIYMSHGTEIKCQELSDTVNSL